MKTYDALFYRFVLSKVSVGQELLALPALNIAGHLHFPSRITWLEIHIGLARMVSSHTQHHSRTGVSE